MRTYKELYTIILDLLKEINDHTNGICFYILHARTRKLITKEEEEFLEKDFKRRRPKLNSYWWPLNEAGEKERIRFLEYLIKTS